MNGPTLWNQRYQPERQLSKRSGRQTWLAQDLTRSEPVILKFLFFGPDFDWADLNLFQREAQILQTLSHPAIPQYRDHFEITLEGGRGLALVQTYIEAPSLQEWIDQGQHFTEPEVRTLAKALLGILTYLHRLHPPVIHRDLKPSNILLGSDQQVYLVDFGSVQAAAPREQGSYTVVGSYGYMPLEQFGGRTVPASDLYSLGATLIHLLTGQHPADLPQEGSRVLFEQAVQLSVPFRDWLRWITEPLVGDRPASAQQALEALENLEHHPGLLRLEAATVPTRQPAGSLIQLSKSEQTFQLVIPAKQLGALVLLPFAIAWNSFITFFTILSVGVAPFPANVVFGLFTLPFWTVGLGMVGGILYALFGKAHLHIDQDRIGLTHEVFGLRFRKVPRSWRRDIDRLELVPRHHKRDSDGDQVEVKPQLNIWAGNRKYELGAGIPLQEPELEWLASELSRWLKIPVTSANQGVFKEKIPSRMPPKDQQLPSQ
ncbi:serine/threonine protein kinase [Synechococcus sp. Nb3U1]|uniref:serine/threonine protein kinase n=1 Tax=Synechococcus sp. Nb3U1 TaxID=1914529 RepID=UPI001F176933|nr:serine/threonine-protein kinase [Synechococcus sp. Nb3U1]MCF2971585.1 serine/threonine protein kinase [Synechococcus sp. Nb3U1]